MFSERWERLDYRCEIFDYITHPFGDAPFDDQSCHSPPSRRSFWFASNRCHNITIGTQMIESHSARDGQDGGLLPLLKLRPSLTHGRREMPSQLSRRKASAGFQALSVKLDSRLQILLLNAPRGP